MSRQAFTSRAVAVSLFAVAMAYVESAAVLYLRTLYGGVDPMARTARPMDVPLSFVAVEVGREAATMAMLATAGWLAGQRFASRFGHFAAAFGIWDIGYYLWLRVFTGWPSGYLDWDVLFLIPLPWWGPVASPMLVALEMVAGGFALAYVSDVWGQVRLTRAALGLLAAGVLVLLVAFMWDALRVVLGISGVATPAAPQSRVPVRFPWEVYLAGQTLTLAGMAWFFRAQRRRSAASRSQP